jgi:hypothetical protein
VLYNKFWQFEYLVNVLECAILNSLSQLVFHWNQELKRPNFPHMNNNN